MHDSKRHNREPEPCPHCAMSCGLCWHCHERAIPAGNRKYCEVCSPRASLIWKREFRAECRRLGVPYQDPWLDPEQRREYQREYMQRWRLRRSVEQREATRRMLGETPGAAGYGTAGERTPAELVTTSEPSRPADRRWFDPTE